MKFAFIILGALFGTPLFAVDTISLNNLSYRGSGCPEGTVSSVSSQDNSAVTILFDRYVARGNSGTGRTRKTCTLNIDVNVPAGTTDLIFEADYRGFKQVSGKNHGSLNIRYRFLDMTTTTSDQFTSGERETLFLKHHAVPRTAIVSTRDGRHTVQIRTSIMVDIPDLAEQAHIALDSIDIKTGGQSKALRERLRDKNRDAFRGWRVAF